MKIKEIMERAGMTQSGRALAYIEDGLEEMNVVSETHVKTTRISIVANTRFYTLPADLVKLIDVRVKSHNNENDKYRSIPRSIYEPTLVDEDGS